MERAFGPKAIPFYQCKFALRVCWVRSKAVIEARAHPTLEVVERDGEWDDGEWDHDQEQCS